MNIDNVLDWFVIPVLKYPLFIYLLHENASTKICLLLALYSVILKLCISLNTWYKSQGTEPWKSLTEIGNAVVLVTGGSSGLGRSIITEILNRYEDVQVINLDLRSSPHPASRIIDIYCDLKDSELLNHSINLIKNRYGSRLSLIVNNAAIRGPYQYLAESNEFTTKDIFAVNTFAPIKIIRELVPLGRQCYVINIASTLGILAPAKLSTYAASKAALIAFHNSYSLELMTSEISRTRTLLVLSGQLDTEMFTGFDPPLQFFAPVVKRKKLAYHLMKCCDSGKRGEICVPYYSNFAQLLMSLPLLPRYLIRKLSRMDRCLP